VPSAANWPSRTELATVVSPHLQECDLSTESRLP
jgi:hypothetical protein